MTVGRAQFVPGWKWSNDVKPIAGTESCLAPHTGHIVAGRLHIVMNDGAEAEVGPGDAVVISPGRNAWIVGDETCVMLDWSGSANYAVPGAVHRDLPASYAVLRPLGVDGSTQGEPPMATIHAPAYGAARSTTDRPEFSLSIRSLLAG